MINILVVDDEPIIRLGIKKILTSAGYNVIGEVGNGIEALDILATNHADIVITDVKMPKMNGIELIKEIKSLYLDIQIVVMSGHGDFEFVRTSLKEGAFDYLLKPASREEILDVISKISLTPERDKNEELKEKLLLDLINSSISMSGDHFLQINIKKDEEVRLVTICWEHSDTAMVEFNKSIQNILKNFPLHAKTRANEYVFIKPEGIPLHDFLPDIYIGISSNGNMDGIPKMYEESKDALMQSLYYNDKRIFYFEKMEYVNKMTDSAAFEGFERRLINEVEIQNSHNAGLITDEIFDCLYENKISPKESFEYLQQLLVVISSRNQAFKATFVKNNSDGFNLNDIIKRYKKYSELREYYRSLVSGTIRQTRLNAQTRDKKIIDDAKKYVRENYFKNISLAEIASVVDRNTAYFSDLFSKEVGKTFTEYLTDIRIEKAKELMKDPTVKLYEIGYLVGYDEPAYFSRVFRKIVGMTPTQYREQNIL